MDTRRLKPSRILLQLLWTPKIGDRVLVTYPQTRRRIARIIEENNYGKEPEYQLDIAGDTWWKTHFLTYVPTRQAYEQLLENLVLQGIINWVDRDPLNKNKYKVAVRCNQTQIIAEGTLPKVLSDILNYRPLDSEINNAVNRIVGATRGTNSATKLRCV